MTASPPTSQYSLRSALASPLAVLLLIPGLVLTVGGVTAVLGWREQRIAALEMGRARLADTGVQVERIVRRLGESARAMSARLEELALTQEQDPSPERWAPVLRDLYVHRPALAYLSLSSPDGRFLGMFPDHKAGGALTYTVQDQQAGGRRCDWVLRDGAWVAGPEVTATGYDPRQRGFYQLAVKQGAPVWTRPYRFFGSAHTGVSYAKPVLRTDGSLLGVVTADLTAGDLSALIASLAGGPNDRLLVTTPDGSVVAAANVTFDESKRTNQDAALTVQELSDPAIAAWRMAGQPEGAAELRDSSGRELLAHATLVQGGGLDLRLVALTPLEPLLAPATAHRNRSLLIIAALLAVSTALAALYARNLVRMRTQVRAARQAAAAAKEEADELGSYVLEKKLGVGGYGEVWRARHRLLARPAALKLVKREAAAEDPSAIERFEREARLTAALTSPHTVTVYDFGLLDDGTVFYAMELLDGCDLAALLQKAGTLPPAAVVHVLRQACDSLGEAHAAGLIHRDIKPANIYLCRRGCRRDIIKVLDFGLATLTSRKAREQPAGTPRLTQAGYINGTPGFMAPEQIHDQALDHRADIYALGCVAFVLLTGKAVFPADGVMAELMRHAQEEPPAPSSVLRSAAVIPEALDQIVQACLARDRAHRPKDVGALRALLDASGIIPAMPEQLLEMAQISRAAVATASVSKLIKVKRKGK